MGVVTCEAKILFALYSTNEALYLLEITTSMEETKLSVR